MDALEMNKRFIRRAPTREKLTVMEENRNRAHYYADFLVLNFPESRELALAITKLEEVVMWSNAAMERREHEV